MDRAKDVSTCSKLNQLSAAVSAIELIPFVSILPLLALTPIGDMASLRRSLTAQFSSPLIVEFIIVTTALLIVLAIIVSFLAIHSTASSFREAINAAKSALTREQRSAREAADERNKLMKCAEDCEFFEKENKMLQKQNNEKFEEIRELRESLSRSNEIAEYRLTQLNKAKKEADNRPIFIATPNNANDAIAKKERQLIDLREKLGIQEEEKNKILSEIKAHSSESQRLKKTIEEIETKYYKTLILAETRLEVLERNKTAIKTLEEELGELNQMNSELTSKLGSCEEQLLTLKANAHHSPKLSNIPKEYNINEKTLELLSPSWRQPSGSRDRQSIWYVQQDRKKGKVPAMPVSGEIRYYKIFWWQEIDGSDIRVIAETTELENATLDKINLDEELAQSLLVLLQNLGMNSDAINSIESVHTAYSADYYVQFATVRWKE